MVIIQGNQYITSVLYQIKILATESKPVSKKAIYDI